VSAPVVTAQAAAERDRPARRRAVAVFVATIGLVAAGWVFLALDVAAGAFDSAASAVTFDLPLLVFPVTGLLVARRQPRNAVAWVLLGIGLAGGIGSLFTGYSTYALTADPGSLPAGDVVGVLSSAMWDPVIIPVATLLLLLFPDGKPLSRRWRIVVWLSVFVMVAVFLGIVLSPGALTADGIPAGIDNPLSIRALEPVAQVLLFALVLLPVCMLLSALSLVLRFRRSRGVERAQLKWLATAAAISASIYALALLSGLGPALFGTEPGPWVSVLDTLALASLLLIPISIGVAILRYRLYDIDRIISRTIAYFLLTAVLVAVYAMIVVGIGTATGRSDNPALIAGATLAVAALFRPVRRRLQDRIDRRLYRRRYDAERVLGSFASRLRDELDLDALSVELLAAVSQTVQPARMGVWIRRREAAQ
jgi:MFS family permease